MCVGSLGEGGLATAASSRCTRALTQHFQAKVHARLSCLRTSVLLRSTSQGTMALRQLGPLVLQQLPKAVAAEANVATRGLRTSVAPRYHYVSRGMGTSCRAREVSKPERSATVILAYFLHSW